MQSGKVIHGDARRNNVTRLRKCWKQMKTRCYNPNAKDYKWYGGKGISICEEWLYDYSVFKTWALSHGYKESLSIDRIDSNGNYEPNNCRWVNMRVQNQNKASVPLYTYRGETHCMAEWARILGMKRETLKDRVIKLGWSFEEAVETPIHKCVRKQH